MVHVKAQLWLQILNTSFLKIVHDKFVMVIPSLTANKHLN